MGIEDQDSVDLQFDEAPCSQGNGKEGMGEKECSLLYIFRQCGSFIRRCWPVVDRAPQSGACRLRDDHPERVQQRTVCV